MKAPPAPPQYETYVGRIARGAGIDSFGQGIGRVLNYATQVALARMYGPAAFGLYVLGTTMVQMATVLAQFGMSNGLLRYVARYRAENDASRVRGTILMVLWTALVLSVTLATVLFFSAGFLAGTVFNEPAAEVVFRVFSVSLPFLTMMNMALWATQGFQTVKYNAYVQQIQRPLINLVLVVLFYLFWDQILGAVAAYAVSMAAGTALALYYLRRTFPQLLDRATVPKYEPRAVFGSSAPMVVANFAQNMNTWIVVTLLGVFVAAEGVGIFNAAARTAALSALVLSAFSGIFAPMVSNLHTRGEMEDLRELYRDVSRWVFTGSLMVFLVTVLLARDVMAIFGPRFVDGWVVMVIVATGQLFNSSTGPVGRVLAMTGHQKIVMLTTLGSAAASLGLGLALIPSYGVMGAGFVAATGLFLGNAVSLLFVRRLVGLWPYDLGYLRPVFAGLLAFTGAYLLKLILPLPTGVWTILVLAPLFMAGFAALVAAFGLSRSDRQLLAALWRAITRKFRADSREA